MICSVGGAVFKNVAKVIGITYVFQNGWNWKFVLMSLQIVYFTVLVELELKMNFFVNKVGFEHFMRVMGFADVFQHMSTCVLIMIMIMYFVFFSICIWKWLEVKWTCLWVKSLFEFLSKLKIYICFSKWYWIHLSDHVCFVFLMFGFKTVSCPFFCFLLFKKCMTLKGLK
jgi:hypothetical protein